MKFKFKSEFLKKILRRFKNKYILTFTIFFIYALFIDDNDIFTIFHYRHRLHKIDTELVENKARLEETQKTISQLNNPDFIEKYARENKFFKKDDEDIFVIIKQ